MGGGRLLRTTAFCPHLVLSLQRGDVRPQVDAVRRLAELVEDATGALLGVVSGAAASSQSDKQTNSKEWGVFKVESALFYPFQLNQTLTQPGGGAFFQAPRGWVELELEQLCTRPAHLVDLGDDGAVLARAVGALRVERVRDVEVEYGEIALVVLGGDVHDAAVEGLDDGHARLGVAVGDADADGGDGGVELGEAENALVGDGECDDALRLGRLLALDVRGCIWLLTCEIKPIWL